MNVIITLSSGVSSKYELSDEDFDEIIYAMSNNETAHISSPIPEVDEVILSGRHIASVVVLA